MLKNYLKSAYRNIKKNKVFALINVLGLTIGMTICLLLLHNVIYEKNFDTMHKNADRIYRLRYERIDSKGDAVRFASCAPPAGALIRDRFPQVEKLARMFFYQASVSSGDLKFYENRIYYADPEFAEIFDFEFISGNPQVDLKTPGNAFVSESTARKYYGADDPIGKTFSIDKIEDYRVVGVYKDAPHNSHIKFDFLLPLENVAARYGDSYMLAWGHTGMYTYVLMQPNADLAVFKQGLADLVEEQVPWLKEINMIMLLPMQPLRDIHLTSHFMQEYEANGNDSTVNYLTIIAFFIIIMAWVNYINLSTARSLTRAHEVGMRKTIGASRTQLAAQFFVETIIINLFVFVLTLVLLKVARPFFNNLTGLPVDVSVWQQSWFWSIYLGLFVVGLFASGFYPIVAMTSFKPISMLKKVPTTTAKGFNLRKVLITFQFAMALLLLISTFTIHNQMSYMQNLGLGFDIEQVFVFKSPRVRSDNPVERFKTFHNTLLQNENILKTCHVTEVPGKQLYWDAGGIKKAGADNTQGKNYQIIGMDYDFVNVFDIEFESGRNFSMDFPSDKDALIFNETAAQWIGFENSEKAIGQQVDYWGKIYTVVGVIKDYHQQSPKAEFEPTIYRFMPTGRDVRGQFAVKMNAQNLNPTIQFIEKTYGEFFPGNPFEAFFLDEYFDQQYKADRMFNQVFVLFSILAIVITVLGILGLSSWNVAIRTKEIGVRKVLGASVPAILYLLSKEYIKWVTFASLLAWPIAWIVLNKWLAGFANRIDIGWWSFLLAAMIALVMALFTVFWQSSKTASSNPIDALRYE